MIKWEIFQRIYKKDKETSIIVRGLLGVAEQLQTNYKYTYFVH